MAINFKNILPLWKNKGEEPPESLKENGFQPGYQPPAKVFNWFWHLISAAINELQGKISEVDNKADSIGLVYDPEYHSIELAGGGHSEGGGGSYTPTAAGPDKLGCIKVGPDFAIAEDGTLSINKANNTDIDNLFTGTAAIRQAEVAKLSTPTRIAPIAVPSSTGDTVRHIKDGSGVYHPVEDTTARQAAEANAEAIAKKVDEEVGKGLSSCDYTREEKNKLEGIEENANKTIVDQDLNDSSGNPVANFVIDKALSEKADAKHGHAVKDISGLEDQLNGKASTDVATQSENGLMSAADKKRFDGMVGIYYGTALNGPDHEYYNVTVQTLSGMSPEITSGGQPPKGMYFIQFDVPNDSDSGFKVVSDGISSKEIFVYNNKGGLYTMADQVDNMLLPFVCTGDKFILMLPDRTLEL